MRKYMIWRRWDFVSVKGDTSGLVIYKGVKYV